MQRNRLIASLLAATALMGWRAAQAVPAVVAPSASVVIQPAPPAPIYEIQPASRDGYVWVPGHHEWTGDRYVWLSGHWKAERPGFEWRDSHWVQRSDGSWHFVAGRWVRDDYAASDDDDRYEHRRHRPRRFGPYGDLDRDGVLNQDDRDRDGDGVRNRFDDYPDDPDRS